MPMTPRIQLVNDGLDCVVSTRRTRIFSDTAFTARLILTQSVICSQWAASGCGMKMSKSSMRH